jgi:nicotinamide riboside transporter PnuC
LGQKSRIYKFLFPAHAHCCPECFTRWPIDLCFAKDQSQTEYKASIAEGITQVMGHLCAFRVMPAAITRYGMGIVVDM